MSGVNTDYSYRGDSTGTSSSKPTDSKGNAISAAFGKQKDNAVSVEDFLNLMVAQLKNQDFMNPVEDTQYVTQLAQFATMQQMQELASYSKSNYAMSLVGKDVTASKFSVSGSLLTKTGPVERVSLVDNEYKIYVDGTPFSLEEIMELNGVSSGSNKPEKEIGKLEITVGDLTGETVSIKWPSASSNSSLAGKLKYTLYLTSDAESDTVEKVEAGLPIGGKDRVGITEETMKGGLKPGTTYYLNVVVTDPDGNKYLYKQKEINVPAKVEEV